MRKFKAGLLAAALVAAVVGSHASALARQDSASDQPPAPDDSQTRPKHVIRYPVHYRAYIQTKTAAPTPAKAQVKDQSKDKDQAKDQSKAQSKDAKAAVQTTAQDRAKDQAKEQTKDQAQVPAQSDAQNQTNNQSDDEAKAWGPSPTQSAGAWCPGNPNALGTSRVIEIDPSQYKRLGHMQYPESLPLNDHEVVLTFDDGPLPPSSNQILDILASQCVKATYFLVGEMAVSFPAVVRRIYAEGHAIGTHSDHHPTGFERLPIDRLRMEIDGGISDVASAFGGDPRFLAPFFRIPGLARTDTIESEAAARGLIIFSADVVADDWFHGISPAQITARAISRLEAAGKGILLLHDIHPKTAAALPAILQQLKDNGFHVVQVVPSAAYEMAMAHKRPTPILVSASPGELVIGGGMDEMSPAPAWPRAADDATSGAAKLPVPDASAFEPDTGFTVDSSAETQWPQPPDLAAPPHLRRSAVRKPEAAGSDEHERLWPERHPARPPRVRASADSRRG